MYLHVHVFLFGGGGGGGVLSLTLIQGREPLRLKEDSTVWYFPKGGGVNLSI